MLVSVIAAVMVFASFLLAARPVAARSLAKPASRSTATAAISTPTPALATSGVAEFSILAVRAENNGGKPDWNFSHGAVTKVTTGTAITLSIYVDFQFVPDAADLTVDFPLTLNGKVIHESGLTSTLRWSDTGDIWLHKTFTPQQSGTYDLSGIVTVGGQTAKASTSFEAVSPPSRPHPFWFTFNGLRSFDSRGQPVTRFAGTDRVSIVASWTAHNLSRPSPVWVTETLEYPVGHSWRGLGQPLQNSFNTSNGPQSYQFTFVPGTAYSSLRIVIRLGIAGKRQQRLVTIQLHK